MAIKCKGCGHKLVGYNSPRLCPKCGGVMVPFVEKKEGKKTKEKFLEKLED
ncbi:MAG: hypothetical protein VB025_09185 [Sphaerochaeta sp.]|nr:hypothetical protein [Sphaerochaeta sp.]